MSEKILVTGATGFFGHHVMDELANHNVIGVGKSDYNLLSTSECRRMFKDISPNVVIHLAAVTGGILKNKEYPADMWYKNTMINSSVFQNAIDFKVRKLIYVLAGCAYPKMRGTMREEDIWNGYPDEHPAPFSLSRKMGLVACTAYRKQYGLNSSVVIPGNMYGEHDCFDIQDCHVIPALMRKIHKSKKDGTPVEVWGSGSAIRDFVYVKDVAACLPFFIENDCSGPVNLSSGKDTSIKELVDKMSKIIGESIEILWNTSMPEGPDRKVFDVSKMKSLGLLCSTPLSEGLNSTYKWFSNKFG